MRNLFGEYFSVLFLISEITIVVSILGAFSTTSTFFTVVLVTTTGFSSPDFDSIFNTFILPVPLLDKTSVPFPSLAKTEALLKERFAVPTAFALNTKVTASPEFPVYPFKITPSNEAIPSPLEKVGSCAHRLITEPVFEIEERDNISFENLTLAAMAFTELEPLPIYTFTFTVSPTS